VDEVAVDASDVEELRRILHPLVLDIESEPFPVITIPKGQKQ
jgi:hypothetical protein